MCSLARSLLVCLRPLSDPPPVVPDDIKFCRESTTLSRQHDGTFRANCRDSYNILCAHQLAVWLGLGLVQGAAAASSVQGAATASATTSTTAWASNHIVIVTGSRTRTHGLLGFTYYYWSNYVKSTVAGHYRCTVSTAVNTSARVLVPPRPLVMAAGASAALSTPAPCVPPRAGVSAAGSFPRGASSRSGPGVRWPGWPRPPCQGPWAKRSSCSVCAGPRAMHEQLDTVQAAPCRVGAVFT